MLQYKTKPKKPPNPINKLKDNTVIGKEIRLIIANKKMRKIVKIADIVKGMFTLQNVKKSNLNCLYSNTKSTEAQSFNEIHRY